MLLSMVETGAARDVWDAALLRRHTLRMQRIDDPERRKQLQQEFLTDRRKRLASAS